MTYFSYVSRLFWLTASVVGLSLVSYAQTNYVVNSANASAPGTYNTLVGPQAGNSMNSSGNSNVFTGYQAGFSNTSGVFNIYSGIGAAYNNAIGSQNVAIGHQAGVGSGSYYDVVAVGYQTGKSNAGSSNVFVGSSAGYFNTTGSYNTFMGTSATPTQRELRMRL